MKIGILQTGHVPDELAQKHGVYPDMFADLLDGYGFEYETWSVVDHVFPSSIHDAGFPLGMKQAAPGRRNGQWAAGALCVALSCLAWSAQALLPNSIAPRAKVAIRVFVFMVLSFPATGPLPAWEQD